MMNTPSAVLLFGVVASLPPEQSITKAAYVLMGAGETGDFLYTPERPGLQKLSISTRLAGWHVPMLLFVRPARQAREKPRDQ